MLLFHWWASEPIKIKFNFIFNWAQWGPACFGFSSFGGLWGGHRPMAPPKGENKAKKASRKAKRVNWMEQSERQINKWNQWNWWNVWLPLPSLCGMKGTGHQAAPLRGKPKQNQTFLFSAREEKLIVAAEEAAFSFFFTWVMGRRPLYRGLTPFHESFWFIPLRPPCFTSLLAPAKTEAAKLINFIKEEIKEWNTKRD